MRRDAIFIGVEVDDAVTDVAVAAKLAEVCPVDIYGMSSHPPRHTVLVEENLDECVPVGVPIGRLMAPYACSSSTTRAQRCNARESPPGSGARAHARPGTLLRMPELPEAERARTTIERGALLRRIVDVDDGDSYVCRPHAPGEIADALVGRELTAAHRRGKAMWVETSGDGPVLGLHLGMAGRIALDEEPAPRGWDRFVVHFEDGGRLALRDKRRLGRARLEPDLAAVGPDAAEITRDDFRARVGRGTAPLKARLMDQAVVSGVGNLLADEILWRARLDPRRPAGGLSTEELDRLRREVRAATRSAIRRGGAHTGDVIAARRRGALCPRCGAEMQRAHRRRPDDLLVPGGAALMIRVRADRAQRGRGGARAATARADVVVGPRSPRQPRRGWPSPAVSAACCGSAAR